MTAPLFDTSTSRSGVSVTAIAAAFALLVGLTVLFVPWEFGAVGYRSIYPRLGWVGGAFLLSCCLFTAAALYPTWPRVVRWAGRALFLAALADYWWHVTVLNGAPSGSVVYPLITVCWVLEWGRSPRRGIPLLLFGVALMFGTVLVIPSFGAQLGLYAPVAQHRAWFGAAFLLVAAGLVVGEWRRWRVVQTASLAALAGLLGHASWLGFVVRSWVGAELYLVLAVASVAEAMGLRVPAASSLRLHVLRPMIVACGLPLLLLGAAASLIAQRAVRAQVRINAQQAASSEAAWLSARARTVISVLNLEREDAALLRGLAEKDAALLRDRLLQLEREMRGMDSAWILDKDGSRFAGSGAVPAKVNFAKREYFQKSMASAEVQISRPFIGSWRQPQIVFSAQLRDASGPLGVLVVGARVETINKEATLASSEYDVLVVDRRDGGLVRSAGARAAPVRKLLRSDSQENREGLSEQFDDEGNLLLLARVPVPDTPWQVVVAAPLVDAYAPLVRMSAAVIGAAFFAALLAFLLGSFSAREVVRRLERLRRSFADLAGTEAVTGPRGSDELEELEASFQRMAEDIERSQRELREAVKTREEFLSIASHELRTPLTALRMSVEGLSRASASAETRPVAVARARKQVDRLTRLISDLLEVSRLSTGRFALELAPTNGVALVKDVLDRLRALHPANADRLRVSLPTSEVLAQWDEQRVEQLLTNLVENGFRYSPPGSQVRVDVEVTSTQLRVSVTDQGIGVPLENQKQLFQAFYRAPNASQMHAGGLGLGLVIAREIAERHGGTLTLESAGANRGSCFSFTLPIVRELQEEPALLLKTS